MSNEKKTAVDLLWDLIPKDTQSMIEKQFDGYNKAKEMEKQQIKDAYWNGSDSIRTKTEILNEAEQFYNETYGK
jgi:hypothetical protein